MQYVLLPASNDQYFLADCKEIIAIKEGVIDAPDFDESNLTYRLMYGTYKGFCAHFSEKSKVGSQAFSYKGFRRVVANKKTPEGAFLNSNIVTKSSTFHVHKMYSCWSDSC